MLRVAKFLIVFVILALSFWVELGRFVSTPSDLPVRSDLVVSLGGDPGQRLKKAADLYFQGYARNILLVGEVPIWGADYLKGLGVEGEHLLVDARAKSSWEEAQAGYALATTKGWHSILVVSDPPHLRRVSWSWNQVFSGSEITLKFIPADLPYWKASYWWLDPESKRWVYSEVEKLFYYMLSYSGAVSLYKIPDAR